MNPLPHTLFVPSQKVSDLAFYHLNDIKYNKRSSQMLGWGLGKVLIGSEGVNSVAFYSMEIKIVLAFNNTVYLPWKESYERIIVQSFVLLSRVLAR